MIGIYTGNGAVAMTYKTIATNYAPKAKKMAAGIEDTINQKTGRDRNLHPSL